MQTIADLLVARTIQLERREEILQKAYNSMKESQKKSLEPQNSGKFIRPDLEPGSLVLAYNKILDSQWGKLFENLWNGPFQITSQEKGGSYNLQELYGTPLKRRFSATQVKPFFLTGGLTLASTILAFI